MIRGLYSAAGGMSATAVQQDMIAHNLSHAVKPGYQRQMLRFEALVPADEMQPPAVSQHTDFSPGTIEFTGNVLDLALDGPGFFVLEGPTGPVYTRSGNFQLSESGRLITMEGLPVLGSGGPIDLPPMTGQIEVLPNGSVVADGMPIDQLRLATFPDFAALNRVGTSYFQPPPGMESQPAEATVFQGHRELSNTSLVQEMVQMISGARHFEASQRALRSIADAVAHNTRPLNR